MPDPISHAEMIAAVKRFIKASVSHADYYGPDNLHPNTAAMRAVLAHLERTQWRPIEEDAPTGWGNFFLVKPKGLHPASGKPFVPTVVQFVEGKLYSPDDELEPLYFGQDEPSAHPLRAELEWMPLPPSPETPR